MEADLRTRLLAATAVTALAGERIAWGDRPQGASLPAITLTLISPGRDYNHGGAEALEGPRVQLDCWAASRAQAVALAKAAIAALEPAATQGATRFGRGFVDDHRDMPTEELPGGVKVHRRSIDLIIWNEPA